MRRASDRLSSPNFWVGVVSLLAFVGLLVFVVGKVLGAPQLVIVGKGLVVPTLVVGAVIAIVVIPVLVIRNRSR